MTTHVDRRFLSPRVCDWLAIAGIVALVIALRAQSLFQPEINMDDSNFLIMGRTLMRGGTPYVDFWDHNPLGGIVLFGLAGRVFGYSFLTLRWLTIAAVALECCLLYRLGGVLGRRTRAVGAVAALVFAVYSLNDLGQAADRFFFHVPLVTLAMYWFLARPWPDHGGTPKPVSPAKLLAIGLFLAASMQLKYLFVVDYAPLFLLVAYEAWLAHGTTRQQRRGDVRRAIEGTVRAWLLMGGPAVIVVGISTAYFASRGLLAVFIRANFTANVIYAATTPNSLGRVVRKLAVQVSSNPLAWLGLLVAPAYLATVREVQRSERRSYAVLGLWFLFSLIAILVARRMDGHHFLQLLPSLSLAVGLTAAGVLGLGNDESGRETNPGGAHARSTLHRQSLALVLIVLGPLLTPAYWSVADSTGTVLRRLFGGEPWPQSADQKIGRYLGAHIQPDESLFVVDYNPILYTMVDARVASPYTLPTYLIDEWYGQVVGIDQAEALDAIMARKPTYMIVQARPNREFTNQSVSKRLAQHLQADYVLEETLPGRETYTLQPVDVKIYRLRASP